MHERSYKRKSKLPPPLCDVDPVFQERFAAFGDADEIRVYRWLETQELEVRLATRLAFPRAVELWQRSLRLRISNMLPGSEIDLPRNAPRDVDFWSRRYSKELCLHLLALSISTTKSIVDLIMGGHYTEAFALERTASERWKNCLYARIRPEDVFRWMPNQWLDPYPELDEIPRNQSTKPTGDDWKLVASRVENLPDEALLTLINVLMKQLNNHIHPTMEGISQIFIDSDRWRPAVGPQFSQLHAQLAMRNVLILEECYLLETIMLGRDKGIPRRRILKFVNGPMYRELRRFFELDSARLDADEPLEPVQLRVEDDDSSKMA